MQAVATLQEQVQMKTLEKGENVDEVKVEDFSYLEYPQDGFLKRVSYGNGDTYVFDLNYVDRINKDTKKNLVGGEGVDNSLNFLKNVYGINEDFTVWYRDENGKMYGASKIVEIPIDVEAPVKLSESLRQGMGVEGDLKVGDVRGRKTLIIDGNSVTENPITNLEELSFFPNLTKLTLKNLNLTDLNGLEYSLNIEQLWLEHTKSADYGGLSFEKKMTGFYPINDSVDEANIVEITNQFPNMTALNIVRMRGNSKLTKIPKLDTLGNINTLYIEENINLTNIYGLSTVKDKTKLINLYLNENDLTDVVTTTDKHEEYNYLLPNITDGNVINMSYIDEYENLETLDCGDGIGINSSKSSSLYESGESDKVGIRYNTNLKYLNGILKDDKKGVSNLLNLKSISFLNCDLIDLETLSVFKSVEEFKLKSINLWGNENFTPSQVNAIAALLDKVVCRISNQYVLALNTNKPSVNLRNMNLTNLDFLDENKTTISLYLVDNPLLSDSQMIYIEKMTQLTYLNLGGCKGINNFSFLTKLPNLKSLLVHGTNITNDVLEKLSCKDCLKQLYIYGCSKITNLSFLNLFKNKLYSQQVGYFDVRGCNLGESDLSMIDKNTYGSVLISGGDLTTMQEVINNAKGDFRVVS